MHRIISLFKSIIMYLAHSAFKDSDVAAEHSVRPKQSVRPKRCNWCIVVLDEKVLTRIALKNSIKN